MDLKTKIYYIVLPTFEEPMIDFNKIFTANITINVSIIKQL